LLSYAEVIKLSCPLKALHEQNRHKARHMGRNTRRFFTGTSVDRNATLGLGFVIVLLSWLCAATAILMLGRGSALLGRLLFTAAGRRHKHAAPTRWQCYQKDAQQCQYSSENTHHGNGKSGTLKRQAQLCTDAIRMNRMKSGSIPTHLLPGVPSM
jgi:hypothetical protein